MEEQTTNTGLKQHLSPWLKWIMVVVGIAVVASLAYYYGISVGTDESNTSSNSDTEVSSEKSTVDETDDWLTLQKRYEVVTAGSGYTLKYPNTWQPSTADLNSAAAVQATGIRPTTLQNDYLLIVSMYDGELSTVVDIIKDQFSSNSSFISQSNTAVGSETGIKLEFQNNSNTNVKPVVYLVNKYGLTFVLSGQGSASSQDEEDTISTIISTFKTIE